MNFKNNFLKLALPFSLHSFVLGCADSPPVVMQKLSPAPISINQQTPKETGDNSLQNFDPYSAPEELQATTKAGKQDPFAFGTEEFNSIISNDLVLRGIISDGKDNYAIVQYQNLSGSIEKDQVGGASTELLPKGVKVEAIDIDSEKLILKLNSKLYEIKIDNRL